MWQAQERGERYWRCWVACGSQSIPVESSPQSCLKADTSEMKSNWDRQACLMWTHIVGADALINIMCEMISLLKSYHQQICTKDQKKEEKKEGSLTCMPTNWDCDRRLMMGKHWNRGERSYKLYNQLRHSSSAICDFGERKQLKNDKSNQQLLTLSTRSSNTSSGISPCDSATGCFAGSKCVFAVLWL